MHNISAKLILVIKLIQSLLFTAIIIYFNMDNQESPKRSVKALLCQIKPVPADKKATVERIKVSLDKYSKKDQLDIVCFSQMSFTSYNHSSKEEALGLAIGQNEGVQFQFAKEVAGKLKSYVVFGYIQKVEEDAQVKLFSSAAVIDRQGSLIKNYRKCHLYYNDKIWAQPGDNFVTFSITNTKKQNIECTLALGSDLNQKDFSSGQFQLADHLVKQKSDLLVLPMSWIDSQNSTLHQNDVSGTYNYWLNRLAPVTQSQRCTLVLSVNKVGIQFDVFAKKDIMFYGSSTAIMLNPHKIISNLDVSNQGFLVVDTFL